MITYTTVVKEELLHICWSKGLFCNKKLKTASGECLEIFKPGLLNVNSGPDFFNARMKIGKLEWAGNVEIHLRSSDWNKHGHHTDPAYDNVILHVVLEMDQEIFSSQGRKVDTLILALPPPVLSLYETVQTGESWLACHRNILRVPRPIINQWYKQLNTERAGQKSGRIIRHLLMGSDREETLILAMASGFGLPLNSLPFEMLTSGIPCQQLFDLKHDQTELEAILFGKSGLLPTQLNQGSYSTKLLNIYREKFSTLPGSPVPAHLWKYLRLRPASFPTLRLSQFASLLNLHLPLTVSLLSFNSISEIERLLKVRASEYWDTHYVFGKCSPHSTKYTGVQAIHSLLINVIVPYLYATGIIDHRPGIVRRANDILHVLEAESNKILKNWSTFGIVPGNAYESQALIQLHKVYCKQKRCLECQLGIHISAIR